MYLGKKGGDGGGVLVRVMNDGVAGDVYMVYGI